MREARTRRDAIYTGSEGGLRFYLQDETDPTLLHSSGIVAPASVWNGKWHHVAGTWDGTTARLFLDGKLVPLVGSGDVHRGAPPTSSDVGGACVWPPARILDLRPVVHHVPPGETEQPRSG